MDIQNKIIIVTGAASGLGAATARICAKQGAKLMLLDKNFEKAQKIAEEIQGIAFECDVTSVPSVKNILEKIVGDYKAIHGVVNCAGIVHAARIVGKSGPMPLEDFHRIVEINLIGTFNVMRLCAEKMMQQIPVDEVGERGVIINTSSIAAFEGQMGQISYAASKGAVHSMTLPAAREFGQFGIRVMSIAPGVMHTPMITGMPETVQKSLSANIPFPKQLGDPEHFAQLVLHIMENSYLNGSTIRLDGALRMG